MVNAPGSPSAIKSPSLERASSFWLRPLVRLFQYMRFPSKAAMITIAFLIPVLLLGWSFISTKNSNIEFSSKERDGVKYVRQVIPLMQAAQLQRYMATKRAIQGTPMAEEAALKQQIEAQLKKVAEVENELGTDLLTQKAYQDVIAKGQEVANVQGDWQKIFSTHSSYVETIRALLTQATDGSNLTLDPDLDTFYLMYGGLLRMPELQEAAGQMRGLGYGLLIKGEFSSDDMQKLTALNTLVLYQKTAVWTASDKVFSLHSELKKELTMDENAAAVTAFSQMVEEGILKAGGKRSDALAYLEAGNKAVNGLYESQLKIVNKLDELLAARISGLVTDRNIMLGLATICVMLACVMFYAFYISMNVGLYKAVQQIKAISQGDLTVQNTIIGTDEITDLLLTTQDSQMALSQIVAAVRNSSSSIASAGSQVASGAQDLSHRTEQSASNIEQTASAMEEISSTAKQTADNAKEADKVATANAAVAQRAGAVISNVINTMQSIHASSSKIADIIGTIDGIAFQTNILALNAAVEAARAGEQGRGFAVVAGEVRSLAQRSAAAAKEIKELINTSVSNVESGTRIVQDAGSTITEMVNNAQRISSLLHEISVAATEQCQGVVQVSDAVQDLDRITQQNATLVQHTASAADSLRDHAQGLVHKVSQFKLDPTHSDS
jgi:methyl-accepting chemotaxis protein